jgi:hypothetical protein
MDLMRRTIESVLAHAGTADPPINRIALCGLSTGIFQYPLGEAVRLVMTAVKEWMSDPEPHRELAHLSFTVWGEDEFELYKTEYMKAFPGAPITQALPGGGAPMLLVGRPVPLPPPPPPPSHLASLSPPRKPPVPSLMRVTGGSLVVAELTKFVCPRCQLPHRLLPPLSGALQCGEKDESIPWELVANRVVLSMRTGLARLADSGTAALQLLHLLRALLGPPVVPPGGAGEDELAAAADVAKLRATVLRAIQGAEQVHAYQHVMFVDFCDVARDSPVQTPTLADDALTSSGSYDDLATVTADGEPVAEADGQPEGAGEAPAE